jgi:hypothetical protein
MMLQPWPLPLLGNSSSCQLIPQTLKPSTQNNENFHFFTQHTITTVISKLWPLFEMITRYLTEVTAKFNPFSKRAKAARLFISLLPAEARSNVNLKTTLLPRTSTAAPVLDVKFSSSHSIAFIFGLAKALTVGYRGWERNKT